MRHTSRKPVKSFFSRVILILIIVVMGAGCGPEAQETPEPDPNTAEAPAQIQVDQTAVFSPTAPDPTLTPANTEAPEPIGVILFIGDGMGGAHRQAAAWMGYGKEGKLAMDGLQVFGSLSTTAVGKMVTDSAAAATAMASGVKTRNGLVGLSPDHEELFTSLDRAQELGLAVGLVTNTQLPHATPAAFAAHAENRWDMAWIAPQLLDAEVNVLLGGGENFFLPAGSQGCHPEPGKREDGRDLTEEAREAGYRTICQPDELAAIDPSETDRLLGVFADEGMPRPFSPTLAEMTETAVKVLSRDPEGFFLVVESGQIDWASHGNAAYNAIQDTLALDEAVQVGLDYAEDHPNSLLIVTADHETGGMSVHSQPTGKPEEDGPFTGPDDFVFYVTWTTDTHTDMDVPVSAQGPGAALLAGRHENTQVFPAVMTALSGQTYLEK